MLVSGASFNTAGPSRTILQAVVRGAIRPVVSPVLAEEYRRVLTRPQFASRHGMTGAKLDRFLTLLLVRAVLDYPTPSPLRAPDPDDQMLWDLLTSQGESTLVTGERALLQAVNHFPGRIFSPREFVGRFLSDPAD